jgi:hypothetical protein
MRRGYLAVRNSCHNTVQLLVLPASDTQVGARYNHRVLCPRRPEGLDLFLKSGPQDVLALRAFGHPTSAYSPDCLR